MIDRKVAATVGICATVVLLVAATSTFDYGTQVRNGPLFTDASYKTLTAACTAAGTGTLSVTKTWPLTTQTVGCVLAFNGGALQPGSGQTVTLAIASAPLTTICDTSLGGKCIITSSNGSIYPQWWGAHCNGDSHDDAPAINAAINSYGNPALGSALITTQKIRTTGGCSIGSTVLVANKTLTIEGDGWGSSSNSLAAGYWKSLPGLAGLSMLELENSSGVHVSNLRFIGDQANKPSAAINFHQTAAGPSNDLNKIDNIWIGDFLGFDSHDTATQFVAGILVDGTDNNNDFNGGSNVWIVGTTYGIDIRQGEFFKTNFERLEIWNSANCAVRSAASFSAKKVFITASGIADFCDYISDAGSGFESPHWNIEDYSSENGNRMFDATNGGSGGSLDGFDNFVCHTCQFQMSSHSNVDGKFVNMTYPSAVGASTLGANIDLEDFSISISGYAGATPVIDLSGCTVGCQFSLILHGSVQSGLSAANIKWDNPGDMYGSTDIDFISGVFVSGGSTSGRSFRYHTDYRFPTFTAQNPVVLGVPTSTCGFVSVGATCGHSADATDLRGTVIVSTGASPPTSGTLFTLTFSAAITPATTCVVVPNGANALPTGDYVMPSAANSSSVVVALQGGAILTASNNYAFAYVCGQPYQ